MQKRRRCYRIRHAGVAVRASASAVQVVTVEGVEHGEVRVVHVGLQRSHADGARDEGNNSKRLHGDDFVEPTEKQQTHVFRVSSHTQRGKRERKGSAFIKRTFPGAIIMNG